MRGTFTLVVRLLVVIGVVVSAEACGPSAATERWEPVSPLRAHADADGASEAGLGWEGGGDEDGGARDGGDLAPPPPMTMPDVAPPSLDVAPEAAPVAEAGRDLPRPVMDGGREVAPMDVADVQPAEVAPAPRGCPSGSACKRVFVTSLGLANGAFGSLAGADTHCQRLAEAAGLVGGWWAWLSDVSGWPAGRFARSAQH
jgi:hypothetical protein